MSLSLSPSMRLAVQWMDEAAALGHDPHGIIGNTMDSPFKSSGQVWISIATGRALERRGLIRVEDNTDAYLVAAEDRAATVRLYGEAHVEALEREANK